MPLTYGSLDLNHMRVRTRVQVILVVRHEAAEDHQDVPGLPVLDQPEVRELQLAGIFAAAVVDDRRRLSPQAQGLLVQLRDDQRVARRLYYVYVTRE